MSLYEAWEKLGNRRNANAKLGEQIVKDIDEMIAVQEQILATQQQTLDKLRGQRDAVIASFQQIDADIADIFGAPPEPAKLHAVG